MRMKNKKSVLSYGFCNYLKMSPKTKRATDPELWKKSDPLWLLSYIDSSAPELWLRLQLPGLFNIPTFIFSAVP